MNSGKFCVKNVDTASISDAADSLYMSEGWLSSIVPRTPGSHAIGPAYTVLYESVDNSKDKKFRNAANYIDDVPPGSIIVSVNDTGIACTTWGDLLSITAHEKGIAGTVISGFARDIRTINNIPYPLFSTGVSMLSAKNRIRLKAVQIPVEVDGVTINPGDLIAADDNGVISISSDNASEVLSRAISVESVERDIAFAVQHGESLEAAREKYGYATPWSRAKSL